MQYTENYSLKLPGYGDNADVGDLNDNTTSIDALIHANRQIEAPAFSTTTAYTAGEMCVYENVLYKFTADKAAGNWDSTKVTATNLADEVTDAAQSGGTEVEANPVEAATADLHKLKVENTVYGIPDPTVTKTATGNPIEFTDGADAPLVKCVTEIQGSQDLHGYDKPWVGGSGKNKLPLVLADIKSANTAGTWSGNTYTYRNVDITILTDSDDNIIGFDVNGTASANLTHFIIAQNVTVSATSIFSCGFVANWYNNGYVCEVTDGTNIFVQTEISGIEIPANTYTVRFAMRTAYTLSHKQILPMIRLSTESDSTFAPYSNICPITAYTEGEIVVSDGDGNTITHTTTYPSAIYRGSEDVVNGKCRKIQVAKVFDGTETWTAEYDYNFYSPSGRGLGGNEASTIVCSHMVNQGIGGNSTDASKMPSLFISPTGNVNVQRTDIEHTGAAMQAWCLAQYQNGTPFTVVYTIENPTDEDIAITNLPIRTLSGYTHIESSTGEMVVDYITQGYQPLVDLIQSSQHVYATTEQVVGKWVDGKDVYERVITFTLPSSSAYTSMSIDLTGVDKAWVVASDSYAINTYNGTKYSSPFGHYMPNPTETDVGGFLVINGASSTYEYKVGQFFYSGEGVLTLRYTKSTATNRTLSKGATDSLKADLSEVKGEDEESVDKVDKVDKVDEPTETIEEKEENAGESNSENER